MKTIHIALTAVAFSLAAGAAYAAESQDEFWQKADKDDDGAVSREEMNAARNALFKRADKNGDNVIGKDEISGLGKVKRSELAARFLGDADADGAISRAEFDAAGRSRFEKIDTDRDGSLSETEIKTLEGRRHGWRARRNP